MSGLLVFSVLPLLTALVWLRMREPDWRGALIQANVAWAAAVAILTEALGGVHLFRSGPVVALWMMGNAAVAVGVWKRRQGLRVQWPIFEPWTLALAGGVAGLVGLAGFIAWVAPPNTPDVLAYHLPRQLMWLQQGGVQHFVTSDERALMMPPLAEMIQAHAFLIAGSDRWANLPQWYAYALGAVVVSVLARDLGCGRRGQWLSAFVFLTTPMAWHEATSAKNDLLVAVWLGVFLWIALRISRAGRAGVSDWLLAGASLGIALATKTTAWLFVAMPLAALARWAWRDGRRAWLVPLFALLIAGPHAGRNLAWYGTPLGEQPAAEGGGQGAETFSPGTLLSGALRNATLHLATPSLAVNTALQKGVEQIHEAVGQDANDRRTTLWFLRYGVEWGQQHEAIAGAPAHFLLGLGALAWWLGRRSWRQTSALPVAFVVVGALCCCLALKWQPTGARLHLPIFLVLAPLSAWAAEGLGRCASVFVAAGCLAGWVPASETQLRPWRTAPTIFSTSRWENYFRFHPRERLAAEMTLVALEAARPASVQVVSRHGFPAPVLARYLAELDGRLWGELPSANHEVPGAVLVVDPSGRPFPPEYSAPGSKDPFRAVGGLAPYELYLPARGTIVSSPSPR